MRRQIMEKLLRSDIQHIRRLMEGTTMDKDRAETQLKDYDPALLPEDILECWNCGSTFDKFRAGRVREAWKAFAREQAEAV